MIKYNNPTPTFTWLPLPHLPQVPQKFIDEIKSRAYPAPSPEEDILHVLELTSPHYKKRVVTKDGVAQASRTTEGYELSEEWTDWVKENITDNFVRTHVSLSIPYDGKTTLHGAHVDHCNTLKLFYLIDRGGDNAETTFYVKPGHPMIWDITTREHIWFTNIDDLVEIDRAQFPLNSWILLNGYVIHGVENVTGDRLNINIFVTPDQFDFDLEFTKKEVK